MDTIKSTVKKAAALALSAAVLTMCGTSVSAIDAPDITPLGAQTAFELSGASKTVELKTNVNTYGKITVKVKTSKKVAGLLVEMDYASTGLTFAPAKSKSLVTASDGKYPNAVFTSQRFSVLFPQDGLDCSGGVDAVELAFSGSATSANSGAVTFTVLEFYDKYYSEIGIDALEFKAEANPAPEHVHTIVTDPAVAATCTTEGKTEGSHCSVCGEIITAQTTTPKTAHTPVTDPAVAATCTSEGKTEGSHCSVCGEIITAQTTTPKTAHTPVTDPAVAATCTTEGKTEGSHCSVCGEIITAQTTTPKTAHTPVTDPAVAATCTSEGKTEGSHCSVCGEILTAQTTTPKTAHTFVNGVCTVCGEKENAEPPAASGKYGDVNGDGTITSEDALLALRRTVGITTLDATGEKAADVDGSGDVTSSDALEILRYSLGISSTSRTGKDF